VVGNAPTHGVQDGPFSGTRGVMVSAADSQELEAARNFARDLRRDAIATTVESHKLRTHSNKLRDELAALRASKPPRRDSFD